MIRALVAACLVLLAGCTAYADGQWTSGNTAWSFTIDNSVPPTGGSGGGLTVWVVLADGSTTAYAIPAGTTTVLQASGPQATVKASGWETTATPGTTLVLTSTGWSAQPPRPAASN